MSNSQGSGTVVVEPLGAYLTLDEMTARYKVSESTLYRWRLAGHGPQPIRIGGQLRYRTSDVLAWEAEAHGQAQGEAS